VVLFNYALKELTAKIVFYGPGLSGKTTNLQYIYDELPLQNKGRLLTLATETDRTLYFDFLPMEAGTFRGIKTRVQIYTVPGQVFYNTTRRMVLKGADGVVFVADSQRAMLEANLESLRNLRENLVAHDLNPNEIPLVIQYNKRDLADVMSVEEMSQKINTLNVPFYESVATEGVGVEDTLKAITNLVLRSVTDRYGAKPGTGLPAAQPAASVAAGGSSSSERWKRPEVTNPFSAAEDDPNVDLGAAEDPFAEGKGDGVAAEKRRRAATQPSTRRGGAEISGGLFNELDIEGVLEDALSGADVTPSPRSISPLGKAWRKVRDLGKGQGMDSVEENEINLMVDGLGTDEQVLPRRNDVTTAPAGPARPDIGFHELELELEAVVLPSHATGTSPGLEVRIDALPGSGEPQRVVVPVRLSIDPDATEAEFNLTLSIKIKRRRT